MVSKLTTNFPPSVHLGLYGLSKNSSQTSGYEIVSSEAAFKILQAAFQLGVRYVDSSPFYGDGQADQLIIQARNHNLNFFINTKVGRSKTPSYFNGSISSISEELSSLKNLHNDHINTIYLHSPPQAFIQDLDNFISFRDQCWNIFGSSIKCGVSLASPAHLQIFNNYLTPIPLQFNMSWFDLRALPFLNKSIQIGHTLTIRSLFASGLLNVLSGEDNRLNLSSHDIRSSWNIENLFANCPQDCNRVRTLNAIFGDNLPSLANSILQVVNGIDNVVIGPLSEKELMSSMSHICKKLSPSLIHNLKNMLPPIACYN